MICSKKNLRTLLKWKHLTFLEKVEKAKKIVTHKIGMMISSKQPPAGLLPCKFASSFIICSFPKKIGRGEVNLPSPLQGARLNRVNNVNRNLTKQERKELE